MDIEWPESSKNTSLRDENATGEEINDIQCLKLNYFGKNRILWLGKMGGIVSFNSKSPAVLLRISYCPRISVSTSRYRSIALL